MHNLLFSIDREMLFLVKYNLTADELLLIKLIFLAQEEHCEYLSMFFEASQLTLSIPEILISLQQKGIITKESFIPQDGDTFDPSEIDFNKRVLNQIFKHSQDLGTELFECYPSSTTINGRIFSLRNVAKNFKSYDNFCFEYGKSIHFNPEIHEQILSLVEYGKENNLIHSGIGDFVISLGWKLLLELKDNGSELFDTSEII